MKTIIPVLLSIIFVLVAGSTHYISADDSTDNKFNEPILSMSEDSRYQLHVQLIVRNVEGHLIGVTEGIHGLYVPHKITDNAFDTIFGEKEIVTVDGIKYEKVPLSDSFKIRDSSSLLPIMVSGLWQIQICDELVSGQIGNPCANIFQVRTNQLVLDEDDSITVSWTILRAMN